MSRFHASTLHAAARSLEAGRSGERFLVAAATTAAAGVRTAEQSRNRAE